MDFKAKIEIDVQEAFDEMRANEQREFIKNNINVLYTDDLVEILRGDGYNVTEM